MNTPYGSIEEVVKNSRFKDVLCFDKHQLLEGRIIQNYMDQILSDSAFKGVVGEIEAEIGIATGRPRYKIPIDRKDKLKGLVKEAGGRLIWDSQTKLWTLTWLREDEVPEELKGYFAGPVAYAFVWYRNITPALTELLDRLTQAFTVYPIFYDAALFEFLITEWAYAPGNFIEPSILLHEGLRKLTGREPRKFTVNDEVRTRQRQDAAYHGAIETEYGPELFDKVVLPRILMNFGIAAFFYPVDVDRIFYVVKGSGFDFWAFEVKHKYPETRKSGVEPFFGINNSELRALQLLLTCSINVLHTILVKPVWNDKLSTMQLYMRNNMREAAWLIYRVIDREYIDRVLNRPMSISGAKTTLTGGGTLQYKPLLVREFSEIGSFSAAQAKIASVIASVMRNPAVERPSVTIEKLEALRQNHI
jgi:hypothetical protein